MPQLHQRGVDLLLNLMDAEEHIDALTRDELRHLIGEAVVVFGQLLDRDMPAEPVKDLNSAAPGVVIADRRSHSVTTGN